MIILGILICAFDFDYFFYFSPHFWIQFMFLVLVHISWKVLYFPFGLMFLVEVYAFEFGLCFWFYQCFQNWIMFLVLIAVYGMNYILGSGVCDCFN